MKLVASLVTIAALTSAAAADGVATGDDTAASTRAKSYVSLGATAGLEWIGSYRAAQIEVGRRISPRWWAHGSLSLGLGQDAPMSTPGRYLSVRGGLEARLPLTFTHDVVRVVGGLDVGYRTLTTTDPYRDEPTVEDGVVLVPHVGLDIGTTIRFRPGIDMTLQGGISGVGASAALAYQW